MDGIEETEKSVWQEFGPWLRRQREIAGKTRKHVAAAIDIHPGQLTRIELGESGTRKETLDALIAELELDAKQAYVKAGFWPPDETEDRGAGRAAEAQRAGDLIENFLTLSPEAQTRALAMIRVMQAEHPELLEMMRPVKIVKPEDPASPDAEEDTG